jgi:hypothetical protein
LFLTAPNTLHHPLRAMTIAFGQSVTLPGQIGTLPVITKMPKAKNAEFAEENNNRMT